MLTLGDNICVLGSKDRQGCGIPEAVWNIVALASIDGSGMYMCLARGDFFGDIVWLVGEIDPIGRPGHPQVPMRGDEALVWWTEAAAFEYYAERIGPERAPKFSLSF
jgi:hypothetical protein